MQLRKAKDVDGDHPIKFLDGTKIKLPVADIDLFMDKYMDMKPLDREKMQQVAVMSKEQFDTILSFFQPKHGKLEKSIYEDDEMLSEAQFDEAAGEKDACYHKVKSRYKVWPSAYASGALVKCRKVGAKNWGKTTTKSKCEPLNLYQKIYVHGLVKARKAEPVAVAGIVTILKENV